MEYERLDFENLKTILTAEHLNHIQDGIENAAGVDSLIYWDRVLDKPFGEAYDYEVFEYDGNFEKLSPSYMLTRSNEDPDSGTVDIQEFTMKMFSAGVHDQMVLKNLAVLTIHNEEDGVTQRVPFIGGSNNCFYFMDEYSDFVVGFRYWDGQTKATEYDFNEDIVPEAGLYLSAGVNEYGQNMLTDRPFTLEFETGQVLVPVEYLPKASSVEEATGDAPTAEQFNALINALREAGYMNWY